MVDGVVVELEILLCCDMKMISLLLGLKAATADQSCPWCVITAAHRHLLPSSTEQYNQPPFSRNIATMLAMKKPEQGMKHAPLVKFEIHNVVPDILHMMLRITDVLERNLIDEMYEKDHEAIVNKTVQNNVIKLKAAIQSCGVPFEIWRSDSSQSQDYTWTSLTGNQKIKILQQLPGKLRGILHEESEDTVIQLWQKFAILYNILNSEDTDADEVLALSKEWIQTFLSLGGIRKGYRNKNVTPYMHILLAHVPYFIQRIGSLKCFAGQAIEKCMDDIKHIFHKKTNKLDACKETLVVRKRIEILHEQQDRGKKRKRAYEKKDETYWSTGKAVQCAEKRRKIEAEVAAITAEEDLENMSDPALRTKLRSLGYVTKVKNRAKLVKMLKDALDKD